MLKLEVKASIVLLLALGAPLVHAANWPDRPVLRATRAATPIVIDGDLSDAAWQAAPEFTEFTQHDPTDGQPASMRTSVRILFDDEAIYFGAQADDPQKPIAPLARRDAFIIADFLSFNIDSQHDRLSGNAFTVTPANQQVDTILFNDIGEDISWDGVWESTTKVVPTGWIAEVRIPFSQLRFPDKDQHVWGINITRRTVRNNEWARIVNTKKGDTGFVSHFADLTGLDGIRRSRPLEVVPYVVGRSDIRTGFGDANPFLENVDHRLDGGVDLKYALTSRLTLTGTVNPDFGQVEVDPAVVNLSAFETFYPEKRPFFTEGLNIFAFGDSPARSHFNFFFAPQLFYSRRIGRTPQGVDGNVAAAPSESTILGAAKVTGKLNGGWSIGVLDALTDVERGRLFDGSKQHVEPMTNYFVSRVTKEIGGGDSRVGFMVTSVNRRLSDELSGLRENAFTGGVDGYTWFRKKSWVAEWAASGSQVSGSPLAISLTQQSSSRYYQRPDAGHVELDPTRDSLSGWAGKAMVSKQTGLWRPNVQLQAYSPGFETNDAGFLQRTDMISGHAILQYVNEDPSKRFRTRNLWIGSWMNRNFDGDTLERGVFVDAFGAFSNYWTYRAALFVTPSAFRDQLTRGGPVVRKLRNWSTDLSFGTDDRKTFYSSVNGHFEGNENGSYVRSGGVTLSARPSPNLFLQLSPYYNHYRDYLQYVTTVPDPSATATFGQRYVFANLEHHSFELGTRVEWTLNAKLSFQLYMQPFIASGDYYDHHELARARTADYVPYTAPVPDLDFNFRSLRGSALVRWEFRPGSALYVVWNENRADVAPVGDFDFGRDIRALPNAPSHDVLLVKLSYWLPI